MARKSWPFKRILLFLGLLITVISGVILWWINVVKPPNGIGIGLVSAALLLVGIGVLLIAGFLYLLP
ncbi:MAG TPA: hypothetical protein DCS93_02845 [Microscillaceae bacterium]|nr:hypothetical protein [Microscillaceae bacterium]